jgi:hypothetical protein
VWSFSEQVEKCARKRVLISMLLEGSNLMEIWVYEYIVQKKNLEALERQIVEGRREYKVSQTGNPLFKL